MMVCVQTFSMHFHFTDGGADHHARQHAHAHAHAPGGMDDDHLTTGHAEDAASDLAGAIARQALSIDIFVFVLLALVAVTRAGLRIRKGIRRERPRYHLLYYRPPLRAPPL